MPCWHHTIVWAVQREIMAFNARCHPTVCAAKGDDSLSTPKIIWPCVHSKGEDNISCLRTSDRVFFSRAMMASHTRCRFTLCMLFKGDNGMHCPILSDCVCWPRFMIACHTRRSSTVYVFEGRWSHSRTDVIQPLVHPNGDDRMRRLTLSDRVCCLSSIQKFHAARRPIVFFFKEQWSCIFSRAMMACHTRRHQTVCTFQGRWLHCHGWSRLAVCIAQWPWWHASPDVVWSCFSIQGRW